jgi:hypothetical protein
MLLRDRTRRLYELAADAHCKTVLPELYRCNEELDKILHERTPFC